MTNDNFWDCECVDDYIHDKKKELTCKVCGALEENQPDSDEAEILVHFSLRRAELEDFLKTPGLQGDVFVQDAGIELDYIRSVLEEIQYVI